MKAIPFKDAIISHNPGQEEINILGGKQEIKDHELKEVAQQFGITNFGTYMAEVWSCTKESEFKYMHYTLAYGSKSPFYKKCNLMT
ncbi:MAG: hypothetical protein ABGW97_03075 [Christiangramia sp.]|uniref:hypothetical protein n=1 Tax=Christiangramia sp. TaxID=1931228 RepID=UPI003242956D